MCVCVRVYVTCRSTLAPSIVCKATEPVYAKCALYALLQWESNCFINPVYSLVNAWVLCPCALAGLLGLAFTKHTLAHFHTYYPKDNIFRHWNRGCHGDWHATLRPRSHIILNMALWNWETPACTTFTHTHILSPHKPLYCKGLWRHPLNHCTFLNLFLFPALPILSSFLISNLSMFIVYAKREESKEIQGRE